jgi:hypothetical protein
VKVRVFAAYSRRVASTAAKVLYVRALLFRERLGIEWRVRLIVRSAKILIIRYTIVRLSEHRRSDYGGKDNNGAENFEFGHGGFL